MTVMYVLDRDALRRWRPWHIYAGGDRFAVFTACGAVFDTRPSVEMRGEVDSESVCGICQRKEEAS